MRLLKKYQSSASAEINLTALLDVVFSILAFFILLSSALIVPSRLGVDLPISDRNSNANQNTSDLKSEDIFLITLDPNGQMLSNGKLVGSQKLEQDIRNFLATSSKGFVVLSADNTNVSYQLVINRLAELRGIAGNRVAIATSKSS
ncbi:MAG: ExbD/TolR family protein [Pseudanabaena sp.]|jgi:biopolymer transport protein ExbD|uniref:ExbD/TolR family protein n=1 Tax=Pseudanabaena mucicola TaxID=71190 RepID=UPI0025783ADD|nr:biopolymer transporter ExbD [Pseudanabaena mucicola]MCA6572397.1 biopolymer transporter ExbD [Pseudanabaena sp. M53BS1SP1A06MG]MCA6583056.1 biopolymer transporter ExbD [Pseudanabaena sp. M34BS1SP1A06MG]MCA6587244.1 biopolymer transporter ExbD [Pseudanabaena sp. M051S1SP1A06QC]MCA6589130.1 biopolymer transporter ExbD [Pseudanabaena sp. M109S1SP1A06QC]MCA6591737.1 biopolymer transporter ExbD [Pseudanabaena sp. M38BS1SP1A06MG]MCA6595127.1 biopolymer transporter ExbD [Pseudanabaena sp. M046S1S